MTRDFHILTASTFVIGAITGVFLYFKTLDTVPKLIPDTQLSGYEVTVDSYGMCEAAKNCVSLRIEQGGTLTRVRYTDAGAVREGGGLEPDKKRLLENALRALLKNTPARSSHMCDTIRDATYRTTIRIGEQSTNLDACTDALPADLDSIIRELL